MIVTLFIAGGRQIGWHVPELAKGVETAKPRPSQAQGRATQSACKAIRVQSYAQEREEVAA
jgi:hypothetical protein